MNEEKRPPEKRPTLEEVFPLPKGMSFGERKFGINPPTPLKAVPVNGQAGDAGQGRPPFQLGWEDPTLHLNVLVQEDAATGKLIGNVSCTDPAMLNKAYVSVAVVGKHESNMIRKTVKLNQPDQHTGGCCGLADFGLLGDAVKNLGTELGLVVFMVV